jgi:gas vesicle protein
MTQMEQQKQGHLSEALEQSMAYLRDRNRIIAESLALGSALGSAPSPKGEKYMKLIHCNKLKENVDAIEAEAKQTAREGIEVTNEEVLNCILELADTLKKMDRDIREGIERIDSGSYRARSEIRQRIDELECKVNHKLDSKKDKWFK